MRRILARTGTGVAAVGLMVGGASVAETPDADEIIRRHIVARGGEEKIRAIRSLTYSGGLYEEGDYKGSGNAFMAFRRPYLRVVGNPESPGGFMEGYDGSAWEWYADPGIVVRTVGAASGATRRGADFDGPFIDYELKGSTVRLGEPGTLDERPVHRLTVVLQDGFAIEYWIDAKSYLVVAEKRSAPIHAFGAPVTSLTRVEDHRPVAGVLFPHRYVEVDVATGASLSSMQWSRIDANRELPLSWFSPPEFERTSLQRLLEHLYYQRTDDRAVMWSYAVYRRAHPDVDTRDGVEMIGYQMLKMGDVKSAIALLQANARDHPHSASSAYELGRAYETAGRAGKARAAYRRALALDPEYRRAAEGLERLR